MLTEHDPMDDHDALPRCLFAPIRLAPEEVAAYRQQYDPLRAVCPPHVTFIFPFHSVFDDDVLVEHITQALGRRAPFEVSFAPARKCADGTVQLPIAQGRELCRALHLQLYRGALERHLSAEYAYTPHVTIARGRTAADELDRLPRAAAATVDRFILERIGPSEASVPIREFRLR